jgi:PAS domain S-box-containing protein
LPTVGRATLTGYASAEDMIGRNVWNMQAPDKERITDGSILKRLMNSDLFALEFTVQRLDGTQVPVEVNLSSTKSADGKLVSYVLIAQDITQRKKLAEKEEKYQQDLRSLAMELSVSEEHERRRIAVGLHDGIGQSLALCRMKLGAIKSIPELAQKTQSIEQIDRLLADIIADTRSLIFELSPPILYELGLAPALTWLAEKTSAEYNLNISVIDNAHAMELPEDLRVFLFQATRELVYNVTKHAKADQVEIRLEVEDGCFNLRVFDNGSGILKDQKPTKEDSVCSIFANDCAILAVN